MPDIITAIALHRNGSFPCLEDPSGAAGAVKAGILSLCFYNPYTEHSALCVAGMGN